MPIGNITYNTIVNLVKNYAKTNCQNVDNKYNSLPAEFKSGYSNKVIISNNGKKAGVNGYCTHTITKSIAKVTGATIDTDMTNFLKTIKVDTKLNTNIPPREFINFINDMVSFCSTKFCFTVSQFNTNKYLVYYTGNTTYPSIKILDADIDLYFRLDTAQDVNDIINSLMNVIKHTFRIQPCRYSVTLSAD